MNTFLSAEQQLLQEHYRAYARETVSPVAKDLAAHKVSLKEFLQSVGQKGYLGLTVPPEFGGQGAPFLNLILFIEAIAEYEPGLALSWAGHTAAIELIKRFGTEKQKSRYLPSLAFGETIATLAVGEEGAGTDFQSVESLAVREANHLTFSGKKTWVVNAEIAGLIIALTRLAKKDSTTSELALLLADTSSGDAIKISPNKARLGMQSACMNDVEFKHMEMSEECLFNWSSSQSDYSGQVGSSKSIAPEQVLFGMDVAKVIVAAAAVGLSESALHQAISHARSRQQFGRNIGQNQAIQWKLADHNVETEAARLHLYRAAWSKDESPSDFRKYAAMCKFFASRAARTHSAEAVQILGAFGISEDSPLERFYRDAKMTEICEGTSEFQKMTLVKELGIL